MSWRTVQTVHAIEGATTATLASRLSRRDQSRFVGRSSELAILDDLFVEDPPASVVLVHGPGGIGKSTLLREIARRGQRRGWAPLFVEGRDLPPMPEALEGALEPAHGEPRPLILFDTYERMTAIGNFLRRGLLPSLPEQAIIVIASRRTPEAAWFQGGWENLAVDVELRPFSDEESHELLAGQGVHDDERAAALVAWAAGSPLALTLGADALNADASWRPENEPPPPDVVRSLIDRLAEVEVDAAYPGVLSVAAVARTVTPELLSDVLPGVDSAEACEWLAARTFSEPLGGGWTLHDLVRRALRDDVRRREPEWERELRRRVADHVYERAAAGDLLMTIDLSHLVQDSAISWGYGWEGSVAYRIDAVKPGDADVVSAAYESWGEKHWMETVAPFFERARDRVAVARDENDRLCGFSIAVTPANAPDFAEDDPLLGPWLAHARAEAPGRNAVLWHDALDLTRDPRGMVQAMVGMAGILRSGLENPRWAYLPIDPRIPAALEFSKVLGGVHIESLDVVYKGKPIECHVLDYGAGGLLGAQRDMIYRELGLALPGSDQAEYADAVREALRNLRVPHELARSELAQGRTQEERAESVRELMRLAAERAFGDTENEKLLQRVLVRGYIDPAPSHEQAADELIMSRATYFRRLRAASERVAEYLVATRDPR